jgi:hypothetical protein
VFEQAYRAVGLQLLAFVWGCRLWRPLLERTYPSIARHRQALSRWGVPAGLRRVIGALGGRSACAGKTCELR